MQVDFNLIGRVAKLVALLGFVLPWVTVSCSGADMLHATGIQLMTGHPEPAGAFAGGQSRISDEAHPAIGVIAAFGVIAIGLFCSLLTRKQTAAATMLVAAVLGIGLSYYSVGNMRSEMQRSIQHEQTKQHDNSFITAEQQDEMGRSIASALKVEEEEGYWVTVLALVIAAVFSGLTLATRTKPEASAQSPSLAS